MSKKKAIKGIVGELDLGKGPFLTLDMPRHPDEASMSFNLEAILRHEFLGKMILIREDSGEEPEDLDLLSENDLAKSYGVI